MHAAHRATNMNMNRKIEPGCSSDGLRPPVMTGKSRETLSGIAVTTPVHRSFAYSTQIGSAALVLDTLKGRL
nr:hypothetical protein CFP56_07480 [Quercus suber]